MRGKPKNTTPFSGPGTDPGREVNSTPVFLDSGESPMVRRLYQERLAAIVVMFLLIGFALQYWIYSRSGFWLEPEGRLGDLLLITVGVALCLIVLLAVRWRSLRKEYVLRDQLDRQLQLLKVAVETMDIGITISDVEGRVLFVNRAEAEMHGRRIDELLGSPIDNTETSRMIERAVADGHAKIETVHRRSDGTEFPVQLIFSPVLDPSGKPFGVVTVCEDISERRRAQAELEENRQQLRGLALHLEQLRENERTRIAHEIHNDLGAALTVLKINLALIEGALAESGSDQLERAHRMSEDIDGMIDLIRSISRQLRPFLLDDVGLIAAVESLCDDLRRKTDIEIVLDLPETEPELSSQEKETLFRAFQEGSTNSLRHARATRITASVTIDPDRTVMEVSDDGVGLKDDPLRSSTAFGLLGLRERVRDLGGTMEIGDSDDGRGTTLRVTLPRNSGDSP